MSLDIWEDGPLPLVVPQTIHPSCETVSCKCLPGHEQSQRQEEVLIFQQKDPDALRTSTKDTAQPQAKSKKSAQQPKSSNNISSNNKSNNKSNNQRPYKHHPSLASSNLRHPHQPTTPTSSVAAIRANSPVTHRTTTPVYNHRPASTNAPVVARGHSRVSTPQTANQLSADLARTHIASMAELEESEEQSGTSSGDSSDEADDG